jgi:hypothetical protein
MIEEKPPRIRRWAPRVLLVVLAPLVCFGLVEGTLRLCGFGYPTEFLISYVQDGRRILVQNNRFGWRFFGPKLSRSPHPIAITRAKPPGTVRIFVFGESAAKGEPQRSPLSTRSRSDCHQP